MTSAILNGVASSVTVRLDPPRPAPSGPLDVAATAREIVQLSRGSVAVASQLLNAYRTGQPQAVADALDRTVAAQLRDNGALTRPATGRNAVAEGQAIARFNAVLSGSVVAPNTDGLTMSQKFDVYASIVQSHGDADARRDLANPAYVEQPTVVAMRNETSTLANRGQGVYDDRMAVISRDRNGAPRVLELTGNTDPSAQYDWRAGDRNTGRAASPGYEQVIARYDPTTHQRKIFGNDLNRDSRPDAGRLEVGTYHYTERAEYNGRRAFASGEGQRAARDINGDGRFDQADATANARTGRRTETGDFQMYIHVGARTNTGSAGCQTISSADYTRFLNAIGTTPRFSYVLVNAR